MKYFIFKYSIFQQKTYKKIISTFWFYVSDIPEVPEEQTATLPGDQQWSGGMVALTGAQWLPFRKNTTNIIRETQLERSV